MHGLRIAIALLTLALAISAARGGADDSAPSPIAQLVAQPPGTDGETTFETLYRWPDLLERAKRKLEQREVRAELAVEQSSPGPLAILAFPPAPAATTRLAGGPPQAPPPSFQPLRPYAPAHARAPPSVPVAD